MPSVNECVIAIYISGIIVVAICGLLKYWKDKVNR